MYSTCDYWSQILQEKKKWTKQVDRALLELKKDLELEVKGNKEYKVKAIIDSTLYGQYVNNNQLPGLYYLVF